MLLSKKEYLIKEHVGMMKLTETYDIFDPATNIKIGIMKDEPSNFLKYLRLAVDKRTLPTTINIYEDENQPPVFSIQKSFTFIRSQVFVFNSNGASIGYFKSKVFTIGGGFTVHDPSGNQIADVSGDWKGWNFKITDMGGQELGVITKKWAGAAKEFFTSADNYMVSLSQTLEEKPVVKILLLAAALSIDTIYKENE
ncbi:MAG TPA: phospholipid scramblase-related protein [Candidatus Wallbacteria bacterium]|nr:phospholipid scramblase-related protein [Candidatus Wallbacteria bacterium]